VKGKGVSVNPTTHRRLWRRRLGVGLLVLTATLAACSSDDEGEGAPDTDPTSEPAAEPPPQPRSFSVVMSGDVLIHTGVWESAEDFAAARGKNGMDFAPMFASLRPVYNSADLAVCHLEVPLAESDGPFLNYPIFSAPPQVINGLEKAGVDACTTASNHSLDTGWEGLKRTLDTMDAKDMPHAGTARTRKESTTPLILDVAGVRVALLSYTYGTNGIPIPSEQPWSVPLIDPGDIKRDAQQARQDGAEVVIVALHHGTEYLTAPDSYQLDVVDKITRSKAIDLVYGHHAHVPQPIDVVNGTWVAYGLGNFVAQQSTDVPDTYRGATVKFTLVERSSGRFEVDQAQFVPTMITPYEGAPMRVLDIRAALRDPETDPSLEPTLRDALASIKRDVYSLGARRQGLTMMRPAN
jgi:poly-gamma-glutamate capsule biosynthesis protein CapA/YwtB (metallophosphatase superfamily)